jgi:TusA-related sulfurtransferase
MKNVIEILEKQYQSFINQERDWNFFLGLTDYVEFINKSPEFSQSLGKIKENKAKEIKLIDKLEKEAVAELLKMKGEILKIIKNEKITKQDLPEALSKLEDYEKGKIDPDHYKSSRLEEGLRNLIKVLSDDEEDFKKRYPRYGLSKKSLARMAKTLEFREKKETELWGAYEKLQLAYKVIHNKEDTQGFRELMEEMELIKNDGGRAYTFSPRNSKFSSSADFRIKEFKKDNYKLYATRIYNYLIQELDKEEAEKPVKEEKINAKVKYDNGILYFRGKEMDFRNKQNQKDLLATLFEDPEKNWYYDEIQENWDDRWEDIKATNPEAKNYWKKFYSAGNDINTAIAIETQVKDFIIKNTKEIRINPKYI